MTSCFDPKLNVNFTCHDSDDFREQCVGWDVEHFQLAPGNYKIGVEMIHTQNIQLSNVSHLVGVLERGLTPNGTNVVTLPLILDSDPLYYCGRMVDKDECPAAISGENYETNSSGGINYVSIAVDADLLNREAVQLTGQPYASLVQQQRVGIRYRDQRRLAQSVTTCMSKLGNQAEPLLVWQQQLIEKQIIEQFLLSIRPPSGTDVKIPDRRAIAWKAEQVIMKYLPHRLTIEQLCNLVGCSSRTLHLGFKERYGSSPGHYARMVALNAVRRQLRNLSQHRTLTDVAMDLGFNHLGRFSQQYKELFAELPSVTVAKSRKDNGRT